MSLQSQDSYGSNADYRGEEDADGHMVVSRTGSSGYSPGSESNIQTPTPERAPRAIIDEEEQEEYRSVFSLVQYPSIRTDFSETTLVGWTNVQSR